MTLPRIVARLTMNWSQGPSEVSMEEMLTITQEAVDAIKQVAPPGSGLRLSTADLPHNGQPALQVAVAEQPGPDDRLLEAQGAHLYLDPTAATMLADKVLDAKLEGAGVRFAIAEQD